jgi:hypothetical protein
MSNMPDDQHEGDEFEIIYRTCITLKNGKKLYAASVGKKAFRLKIRKK